MVKSGKVFNVMKNTFLNKRKIPKNIYIEDLKIIVRQTILYSSETWALT